MNAEQAESIINIGRGIALFLTGTNLFLLFILITLRSIKLILTNEGTADHATDK